MSLISRMITYGQKAVYWALLGADSAGVVDYDDYGQPQYTDPVEINCRWEEITIEFLDSQGTRQLSNARVYVGQDVDIGGVLMLGELADVTDDDIPKENDNAWEIRRFEKLPTLRNRETLRTVFL